MGLYGGLYEIYRRLLDKYFDRRIRQSVSVDEWKWGCGGHFSYSDDIILPLKKGEPVTASNEEYVPEYSEKRISTLFLTPLIRKGRILAFIFTYDWRVLSPTTDYFESESWVVSRKPFKIKVRHNPAFSPDSDYEYEPWVEEIEAIVDGEVFNLMLKVYKEGRRSGKPA